MLKGMMDSTPDYIIKAQDVAKRIYDEELPKNHADILEAIKNTLISLNNKNIENIKKI